MSPLARGTAWKPCLHVVTIWWPDTARIHESVFMMPCKALLNPEVMQLMRLRNFWSIRAIWIPYSTWSLRALPRNHNTMLSCFITPIHVHLRLYCVLLAEGHQSIYCPMVFIVVVGVIHCNNNAQLLFAYINRPFYKVIFLEFSSNKCIFVLCTSGFLLQI
jgi:hypothetical protein